jgi:hypothetical protein
VQRRHESGRESDVRTYSFRRATDRRADATDTAGRWRRGNEPIHAEKDPARGGQRKPVAARERPRARGKGDSLARLLAEYAEARSFRTLADRHGIRRPEIRRAFRRAAERLEAGGREQQALAAWIRALIDKANPFDEGESKQQAAKRGDVYASDDPRIADFRVRVEDGLLSKILAPRGNL